MGKINYTVRTGDKKHGFNYYFFEMLWAATQLWESCTSKDKAVLINNRSGIVIKRKGT